MIPSQNKLKPLLKQLRLEKPKASCSAFVFFAKDKRKELQDVYKDDSFQDISTKLGELWKNLPENEKEYYEELSLIDKCRFKEEKRLYKKLLYQRLSKAIQEGSVQPSSIDLSILPPSKQTRSSFMFFSRFVRPMLRLHGECEKPQIISKPLSVMWNSLNPNQRIPFVNMSQEDTERTREERLQFHEINAYVSSRPSYI